MGTDMNFQFQKKTAEGWADIPSALSVGRHYQLFAVLADQRNGHGFAGCLTGDRVEPIAEPRGAPPDWPKLPDDWDEHEGDGRPHTWLTAEEMLAWYATAPTVRQCGIVDKDTYEEYKGKRPPWCLGDTSAGFVEEANIPDLPKGSWRYVRMWWESDLRQELGYFFEEVSRLSEEHGEVRVLLWFWS